MDIANKLLSFVCANKRGVTEEHIPFRFPGMRTSAKAKAFHYSWPYPHVVIDEFLEEEALQEIHAYIGGVKEGTSTSFHYFKLYDLFASSVAFGSNSLLNSFFDLSYKKGMEDLFRIPLTDHTSIAFHRNIPRTEDKYIHTDAVDISFENDAPQGRLVASERGSYNDDGTRNPGPAGSIKERRSLTAILYLSPDWKPGMGGTTGIFSKSGNTYIPVTYIEPRYNRLFIMELQPHAYHNYTACSLPKRDTLIQWFHSPLA